jgi:hypothetical protein
MSILNQPGAAGDLQIIDIIEDVVGAMSTPPNFVFGDPVEVITKLSQQSKTAATAAVKYPLVALFTDIEETNTGDTGYMYEVNIPTVIFACWTDSKYMAEQRLARSIKATLQPLYVEFLQKIAADGRFAVTDWRQIPHTKINRLSWGRSAVFSANNVSNDFIDAIEIQNLSLRVYRNNC